MDKLKLPNPIKWLKTKSQFRYKKFVNEGDDGAGNNMKYVPLVNEYSPKWPKKKFKKTTGKGYKGKKKRQKGKKSQLGKGKRRRSKRK